MQLFPSSSCSTGRHTFDHAAAVAIKIDQTIPSTAATACFVRQIIGHAQFRYAAICSLGASLLRFLDMTNGAPFGCDGCGQLASSEHVTRRLERLEWSTRYRPVHIGTLLLGAVAPQKDSDFLYAGSGEFTGEAAMVLEAVGITSRGKPPEATLAEFQRGGFFLAHALECPAEDANASPATIQGLLEQQLASVMARIRRSLKPKKLVPISRLLETALSRFHAGALGCVVILDDTRPFALDGELPMEAALRLREALSAAIAARSGSG